MPKGPEGGLVETIILDLGVYVCTLYTVHSMCTQFNIFVASSYCDMILWAIVVSNVAGFRLLLTLRLPFKKAFRFFSLLR